MLGVKLLMTDQPENIKTILATKVSMGDSRPKAYLRFASVLGLWERGRLPQNLA